MSQLTLSYFDMHGGRAEPIRLAFHIGGIEFLDHRFDLESFDEERLRTPLGQVPTLEVDGIKITQSNAILRYAGKLSKLYPSDTHQALLCDEILDAAEDCTNKIVPTLFLSGEKQKAAREQLARIDLPKYLKFFEHKLTEQGGNWFADNQLTIAELKILALVNWLNSGWLDHLPTDLVEKFAPQVQQLQIKVTNLDTIKNYYDSFKQSAF